MFLVVVDLLALLLSTLGHDSLRLFRVLDVLEPSAG
jgi:hypothetical protein